MQFSARIHDTDRFGGNASKEVDEAWASIGARCKQLSYYQDLPACDVNTYLFSIIVAWVAVDEDIARASRIPEGNTKIQPNPENGKQRYPVSIEALHQIHCLVSLSISTHKNWCLTTICRIF